jgi:carbamoyl-phosphate synthase small subunit
VIAANGDGRKDDSGSRRRGILQLEDGTIFDGTLFGGDPPADGEVVFNTGMVGYEQSLTDPSYRGQILAFTYPLMGNYGVPEFREGSDHFESDSIQVKGVIVQKLIREYSHHRASMGLHDWLESNDIAGIEGIDTRELTKILRNRGTMLGRIVEVGDPDRPFRVVDPNRRDLVGEVSCKEIREYKPRGRIKANVVLIDCGTKRSIMRALLRRGIRVTAIPYDHDLKGLDIEGIMISNGPGDPTMLDATIKNVAHIMRSDDPPPIAGICLGCQIMALSAGAKTYKLPFGHRSQNQPCRVLNSENCVITSQNHGFAVDGSSLPDGWDVWYSNLNDGSVEGIRHRELPFFSVQFHPEANPGPVDSGDFFDLFAEAISRG